MRSRILRFLSAAVTLALAVPAANTFEIGTNDFRISDMGTNGASAPIALIPVVAYNSTNHEFLVVWYGDEGGLGESEIYGQRIDARTGAELGTNDFRISDMGPDGNVSYKVSDVSVAYNSNSNEYLVVWRGDDNSGTLVDDEFEIFGQRLNAATGAEVGTNDFRISNMGVDGSTAGVADVPWVVYNSVSDAYLVVWRGHHGTSEFEIYGQRLTGTGAETGTNDFRISDAGTDGDTTRLALDAKAAHNSVNNEYLVVWQADDLTADNEVEIFGQRLNAATGAEVGTNDFRISDMGPEGDTNYRGQAPAVAYNSVTNEYLVVFYGTDPAFLGAEVIGQRIAGATGAEVGTNDFLISDAGPSDSDLYNVNYPSVAFSVAAREYVVVWPSDDNQSTTVDNEFEIWGQRLDLTGAHVGTNDFRISAMGPDGSTNFSAGDPDVAISSNGRALIVWRSDDDTAPLVDDENEIFGQLYQLPYGSVVDLSGDGRTEIVLRNYSTGQNAIWRMRGLSFTGVSDLPALPNVNFWNAGTADFNSDGNVDILWRNMTTGQNAVWRMNGTSLSGVTDLPALPNTSYRFEGTGDFNGDGKTDIVLRNATTGQNAVWLMNGTSLQSVVDLPQLANTNFDIEGTGDFNADGKTDIVLRNYATGQNAVWRMNGTTLLGITDLPLLANTSYRIGAIGDYNLDGRPDIVWRNYSTGQNAVWTMNGTTLQGVTDLPALTNLNFQITGPR
jgi:hypothetical protein